MFTDSNIRYVDDLPLHIRETNPNLNPNPNPRGGRLFMRIIRELGIEKFNFNFNNLKNKLDF
jgi:hypothetical protein